MKNKRTAQSAFFNLRRLLTTVVCGASILTGTLFAFFRSDTPNGAHPAGAGLTFAERVAYQRAIEEVYWRHRIWPKERPDPKPSLDAVMSQAAIEQKVQDYLRNSELLEDYWQKPITPEQLQAEMERMAQHTQTARGVARTLCRARQRSFCHRRVSGQAGAVRAFAVRCG